MSHAILLLLLLAPLSAQPDRFGLPSCSGPEQELAVKHAFIVCHSGSLKAPVWAVHEITLSSLSAAGPFRRSRFRRDLTLAMPSASDSDYRNSGFSRGHLIPARDMARDEQALSDSFLLSNAVPQNSMMNSSVWRRVENRTRKLAESADSVIVVTGAIFEENAERIGVGRVGVPSELYKVILIVSGTQFRLIAFAVPNTETGDQPLDAFTVPVTEVKKRTGLRFFPKLSVKAFRGTSE